MGLVRFWHTRSIPVERSFMVLQCCSEDLRKTIAMPIRVVAKVVAWLVHDVNQSQCTVMQGSTSILSCVMELHRRKSSMPWQAWTNLTMELRPHTKLGPNELVSLLEEPATCF